MQSHARLLGHPIHPMLVVFPLGLLIASFIFDLMYLAGGNKIWPLVSYYMIAAGLIGGFIAAIFGLLDWLPIPKATRAKYVGLWHALGNVLTLSLFGLSFWFRTADPTSPNAAAVILSFMGLLFGAVSGWLGGELVTRMGVSVDPDANINAPSSIEQSKWFNRFEEWDRSA